jgi:hypothetical protein
MLCVDLESFRMDREWLRMDRGGITMDAERLRVDLGAFRMDREPFRVDRERFRMDDTHAPKSNRSNSARSSLACSPTSLRMLLSVPILIGSCAGMVTWCSLGPCVVRRT